MRLSRRAVAMFLACSCASVIFGQERKTANLAAAPPNLLLLLHQEVPSERSAQRSRLEAMFSRACDRLDAPSFWISVQSLSGSRDVLFLHPFDSFQQWEQSRADWVQFYAAHLDLSRFQEEIDALGVSERVSLAVRRDDLGYLAGGIDLSEMRFLRTIEVHLFPGHEGSFIESLKILAGALAKIQADIPWVVYQVKIGEPTPAFVIFVPMSTLAVNDDIFSWEQDLPGAEGEDTAEHLQQMARESLANTESHLYLVRPDMSHVSHEFGDGDPDFWRPGIASDPKAEPKPEPKPPKKGTQERKSAPPNSSRLVAPGAWPSVFPVSAERPAEIQFVGSFVREISQGSLFD